jgi:hypothetical protein
VTKACQLFLVPSRSSNTPLYPSKGCELRNVLRLLLFRCFLLGLTFEPFEELGVRHDDSQISSHALSLLSWGTPCPPIVTALDLSIDHTNLEYLVTDNICNNLVSSFTHHCTTSTNSNSHKSNILHLRSSIKCNLQV